MVIMGDCMGDWVDVVDIVIDWVDVVDMVIDTSADSVIESIDSLIDSDDVVDDNDVDRVFNESAICVFKAKVL